MMDYLLLLITKLITRCPTTQVRIVAGSIVSAVSTCVIYLLPISSNLLKFALFHVVVNTMMIRVGFKYISVRIFIQCLISMYIGVFILGGVFYYFQQYLKIGSLYFFLAIMSYLVVRGILWFISSMQMQKQFMVEVEVFLGEESIKIGACVDTGNGLVEPLSGKPVHVLECIKGNDIISGWAKKACYTIPFSSIGGMGTMNAFSADRMHVIGERECWCTGPIIAISNHSVSKKQMYNMILNPNIF